MTGLLWLPPPEKHLSATYRTFRGLRGKNRASHKIKDSKIWKANVGTTGPGNLLTFETPRYAIEGKSLLYMKQRDQPTLCCSFDDSGQIQKLNIGSFVLKRKQKDGKLRALCRAPDLPRKPQAHAGVQSLQREELNEPDRAGQLCTKLMALFC